MRQHLERQLWEGPIVTATQVKNIHLELLAEASRRGASILETPGTLSLSPRSNAVKSISEYGQIGRYLADLHDCGIFLLHFGHDKESSNGAGKRSFLFLK
jgi:hypothetical protein